MGSMIKVSLQLITQPSQKSRYKTNDPFDKIKASALQADRRIKFDNSEHQCANKSEPAAQICKANSGSSYMYVLQVKHRPTSQLQTYNL